MKTDETKPIYLQLAQLICNNIICDIYKQEDRIPSLREFAVKFEVNPNTVMRSFELLQQKDIIYNKRGIGYFVSHQAKKLILSYRRELFYKETLPEFFKTLQQLEIDIKEIDNKYKEYNKEI
ncbi:MAG: GntR family transcriptional regulator [Bacteroidales bacterium]|jgi:DNA-binding transcriptional regulator YhcF (GntR family)|nr:GntR family transcriptional regulator [Bacteroidales bacterium]